MSQLLTKVARRTQGLPGTAYYGLCLRADVSIGYYGGFDEHDRMRVTKVHAHVAGRGPACGAKLADYMSYHYCSATNGEYVECGHCKKALEI